MRIDIANTWTFICGYTENWLNLVSELWRRIHTPLQYPVFIMYFVSLMLGVGLTGTWIAVYQSSNNQLLADVPNSIATYAIAVVASAFAEVVLTERSRDSSTEGAKVAHATFRMFALMVVIVSVAFSLLALTLTTATIALRTKFSVFSAILSLVLWWMVNTDNPSLQEQSSDPSAPLGGPDGQALSGTLDGLKS